MMSEIVPMYVRRIGDIRKLMLGKTISKCIVHDVENDTNVTIGNAEGLRIDISVNFITGASYFALMHNGEPFTQALRLYDVIVTRIPTPQDPEPRYDITGTKNGAAVTVQLFAQREKERQNDT